MAATLLLLFVSASFLAPAAIAAIAPMPSHACCMRKAQHQHCGAAQQESGVTAAAQCNRACACAGVVVQSPVKAEPAWAAVSAPNSHPFLDEFFPVSAPASQPQAISNRAPPLTSSR